MQTYEKRSPEIIKEKVLAKILEKDLKSRMVSLNELTGGYYGRVYVADMEKDDNSVRKIVIKIVDANDDYSYEIEPNDNRVYGGRWSNLKPAYDVLIAHGFSVPKIYSIGNHQETNCSYSIMEFIEGESVREFLAYNNHPQMEQLHSLVGETMGMMHKITRDYQGWVAMDKKYAKDWEQSFFQSFESHLANAAEKNPFVNEQRNALTEFAAKKRAEWTNPENFVFSHTDGFQAIAKYENDKWKIAGIIDIEDHQFTDPRFVLTGHELSLEFEGRSIPATFWEGYNKHASVDKNYQNLKELFKLYYLLSWLPGVYDNWRGKSDEKNKSTKHFEKLILDIISNK